MKEQLAFMNYYMDLHVHLGRTTNNAPVKITASKNMTLEAVLLEASNNKGMDIIGIIDCLSPSVLSEIEQFIHEGRATELSEGGVLFDGKITVILGAEIELYDENCKGPIHVLCYFPTIADMKSFSTWCSHYIKNIHLSTQRIYISAKELQTKVKKMGGWFIPAHVFTPFKSVYGKGVDTFMEEVFNLEHIDAIELGLSSDTSMGSKLSELVPFPFLTNSDAHSVKMIAREHQVIQTEAPTFQEINKALQSSKGRSITKNVGLSPKLGKYFQTVCKYCHKTMNEASSCNHDERSTVKGVSERINELTLQQQIISTASKAKSKFYRPPYLHQAPLEMIPGIGPKTIQSLIYKFGSEMVILHEVPSRALNEVLSPKFVKIVDLMRSGKLAIIPGGGGTKGRIIE
ncbi:endonuclease Q family protein [Salipaludibacillus sp. HK11]|uniref:endonuclease Q family protein n=1 Tax=Salipaludibacillus sp. HK11 TaxID=3394320 RepID=UPI0039FC8C1C